MHSLLAQQHTQARTGTLRRSHTAVSWLPPASNRAVSWSRPRPCRRPAWLYRSAQAAMPCAPAGLAPRRVSAPNGRIVAERRARTWPYRGLGCDTGSPLVRFACHNTVPCIAIQFVPSQPTSIAIQYNPAIQYFPRLQYNLATSLPAIQFFWSQYNPCIVTQDLN